MAGSGLLEKGVGLAFAVMFLATGFLTLGDYGITVDSPQNFLWGGIYLKFYETGNKTFLDYEVGKNPLIENPPEPTHIFYGRLKYMPWMYPPVANVLSALTHRIFHEKLGWLNDIDAHHVAIIVLSGIAVYVLFLMTNEAYGFIPASITALSLSLYPRFIAHSHNNVKDAPMACFFVFTLYSFWKAVKTRELKWSIVSGIMLGLSLNIKINAYFIPIILGLWLLLTYVGGETKAILPYVKRRKRYIKLGIRETSYPFKYNLLVIALTAAVVVYSTWPYLWERPMGRLIESFKHFANVGGDSPVLYNGVYYSSARDVPFYYAVHYLLIVTPPILLFFIALGLWKMKGFLASNRKSDADEKSMSVLILAWIGVPLFRYMIPGTVFMDGIRHFLEVVPPLCIVAGIGGGWLYVFIASRLERYGWVSSLCAGIIFILLYTPLVHTLTRIHPYEIAYFNSLVGGVRGAEGNYEIAYWGTAFREAGEWVAARKNENDSVVSPLWWHLPTYYVNETGTFSPKERNYVMVMVDPSLYNSTWFPSIATNLTKYVLENEDPVHTVEVEDVPLVKIYELNKNCLIAVMKPDIPAEQRKQIIKSFCPGKSKK
jgi:hypothetical protein